MRTKYMAALAAVAGLLVAGTALAYTLNTRNVRADDHPAPTVTEVETTNCCLTGDCCCPGQGSCCDPAAKAAAETSGVKYVKKAGAGCCATGDCCCPGRGSCCAATAAKADAKPTICPLTGEELACPNCCPLNKTKK